MKKKLMFLAAIILLGLNAYTLLGQGDSIICPDGSECPPGFYCHPVPEGYYICMPGSGGSDHITVKCYDSRPGTAFSKRECNLATRCAKVKCSMFSHEGTCTLY